MSKTRNEDDLTDEEVGMNSVHILAEWVDEPKEDAIAFFKEATRLVAEAEAGQLARDK